MADDGYSQVGGGGSVLWEVDVRQGGIKEIKPNGKPQGSNLKGHDKYDKDDADKTVDYLKIEIHEPPGGFKEIIDNNKKTMYIPIDPDNKNQVRVTWAIKKDKVPLKLQ